MKVGFINTCKINIDLATIPDSNPGIGGTEYLFLNVPYQLSIQPGLEVTLFSIPNTVLTHPGQLKLRKVDDVDQAYETSSAEQFDVLVTREDQIPLARKDGKTKLVLWLHLTHSAAEIKRFAKFFDAIIFVSNYEKMRYSRIRSIREKSHSVYNLVPTLGHEQKRSEKNGHTIGFVGSLTEAKGFDSLTAVFPNIVKSIKDAKMSVVGSGALYDADAPLGKHGVASPEYEKRIFRPLDKSGTTELVSFFGKKRTDEMAAILSDVDVGVVNLPANINETFCMSVFDFARFDIPVVCRRVGGIKEVVPKACSYGYKRRSRNCLKRAVVKALRDDKRSKKGRDQYDFLYHRFSKERVLDSWKIVLESIVTSERPNTSFSMCAHSFFLGVLDSLNTLKTVVVKWLVAAKHKLVSAIAHQ